MTTEELKALRSRVLDAINRELQPTRMNDEELLKAITALVEREGRGGYLLPIQKMDTVNGIKCTVVWAACWIPFLQMKM